MDVDSDPRLVLVHDWLTGMRGGEKCLEVLCRRFPQARLYTLLHRRGSVSDAIEALKPRCTFLQNLPHVHRYYRYLLPLMPWAARRRLPDCDLVLSFSHCVAKAACPPPGVPHICYCFTPMRYAWHLRDAYFARRSGLSGRLRDRWLEWLRDWDRQTSAGVSHFIAISRTVQQRIADCYGRSSEVIYPPVDTDFFQPARVSRENFYMALSALVPYKRLDLAVAACNRFGRDLMVIGSGPEEKRLRALAGPRIRFLGWQPATIVRDHLQRCRALLFPGEEDFGIVPVEAQACGTPVIAFGRGGASETVMPPGGKHDPTGLFFADQSVESLIAAMKEFERDSADFAPEAARHHACRFDQRRFEQEMLDFIAACGLAGPAKPQAATGIHHGQHGAGVHTATRTVTC